jgi:hypothetical protein
MSIYIRQDRGNGKNSQSSQVTSVTKEETIKIVGEGLTTFILVSLRKYIKFHHES